MCDSALYYTAPPHERVDVRVHDSSFVDFRWRIDPVCRDSFVVLSRRAEIMESNGRDYRAPRISSIRISSSRVDGVDKPFWRVRIGVYKAFVVMRLRRDDLRPRDERRSCVRTSTVMTKRVPAADKTKERAARRRADEEAADAETNVADVGLVAGASSGAATRGDAAGVTETTGAGAPKVPMGRVPQVDAEVARDSSGAGTMSVALGRVPMMEAGPSVRRFGFSLDVSAGPPSCGDDDKTLPLPSGLRFKWGEYAKVRITADEIASIARPKPDVWRF